VCSLPTPSRACRVWTNGLFLLPLAPNPDVAPVPTLGRAHVVRTSYACCPVPCATGYGGIRDPCLGEHQGPSEWVRIAPYPRFAVIQGFQLNTPGGALCAVRNFWRWPSCCLCSGHRIGRVTTWAQHDPGSMLAPSRCHWRLNLRLLAQSAHVSNLDWKVSRCARWTAT
jgi:hypothetical protein